MPAPASLDDHYGLPPSVHAELDGAVLTVTLDRPQKRNALDNATVEGFRRIFSAPPDDACCAILVAEGEHFSAGLDFSSLTGTDTFEGVLHSRNWHDAFSHLEKGRLPIISVLKGAVIGGGLELAASTHIRIAEPSAFFALPEGTRGLFVGGGASVKVSRLMGVAAMTDLMLTGRVLDADDGHRLGLCQYLVEPGDGLAKAQELAAKIAANSPVTNYAVLQALPRIAEVGPDEGLFMESLIAAVSSGSDEAKERMHAFLQGKAAKVGVADEGDA